MAHSRSLSSHSCCYQGLCIESKWLIADSYSVVCYYQVPISVSDGLFDLIVADHNFANLKVLVLQKVLCLVCSQLCLLLVEVRINQLVALLLHR